MAYFIAGAALGAVAAAWAMALVSGKREARAAQQLREKTAAVRTLTAEYKAAQDRVNYWQQEYWRLRSCQRANTPAPEAREAEQVCK